MPKVPLNGSVGAGGENDSSDVRAVRLRLRELGFRWLKETGLANAELTRTIKLFQGILNGLGSGSGQDGLIEVGKKTHRGLQAENSPRWQKIESSTGSVGWKKLLQPGDPHDFGTDWLFQVINESGVRYHEDYLKEHSGSTRILVNDVALPEGDNTPHHAGHETGLMCDLRLPRKDGGEGGTELGKSSYDQAAARAILQAFQTNSDSGPGKAFAFFNDGELINEKLCRFAEDHHNHIHVQIRPPELVAEEAVPLHTLSDAAGAIPAAFPNDQDWITEADLAESGHVKPELELSTLDTPLSSASWATDTLSPDYKHLEVAFSAEKFKLTGANLRELCELNRFKPEGGQDEVLFGLRGCRLAEGQDNEFATTVWLHEDKPDHFDFHCALGVWKPSANQLAVFRGSTVPNRRLMRVQLQNGGQVCNLLPTGRYRYRVGTHRDQIVGVFRQEDEVVVLRTRDDLTYERTDYYERHHPADNIHPSLSDPDAHFSSAGCMTIPGRYVAGSGQGHRGDWALFRRRAGLSEQDDSKLGEEFIYILLTGREARLAVAGTAPVRLRIGSRGDDVRALQGKLGFTGAQVDGDMGKTTAFALIRWQQSKPGNAADGIDVPPFA